MTCEIIQGDSTLIAPTITGPIHAIITDPPYGMAFHSGSAQTADGLKWVEDIANDGDIDVAIGIFLAAMFPLVENSADEAEMYVFCRWSMIGRWIEAVNALEPFVVKNLLVWDKGTPGMGDVEANWGFSYEAIVYAKKGRRPIPNRRSSVIAVDRTPSNKHIHPTQKPVELLEILLRMSTSPGDLVVDPFAGSGSTIVACERLGRRGIGIELSPAFAERAQARLGQNLMDLGV